MFTVKYFVSDLVPMEKDSLEMPGFFFPIREDDVLVGLMHPKAVATFLRDAVDEGIQTKQISLNAFLALYKQSSGNEKSLIEIVDEFVASATSGESDEPVHN